MLHHYRDYKAFNKEKCLEDIDAAPWELVNIFHDIDDKVDIFYQLITQLLDWHAPKQQKRIKHESYPVKSRN